MHQPLVLLNISTINIGKINCFCLKNVRTEAAFLQYAKPYVCNIYLGT